LLSILGDYSANTVYLGSYIVCARCTIDRQRSTWRRQLHRRKRR